MAGASSRGPGAERVLTFAPGPRFRIPDLGSAHEGVHADPPEVVRLHATYFDTEDLRLARAGASLRHRDDEGWTVELPVAGRGEVVTPREVHVDGDAGAPPRAAVDLVRAVVRRAPLVPVARLNTLRRRVVLRDMQGAAVAEVVDDEVSLLDGIRLTARFRELEVGLAPEAPGSLAAALAGRLRAAGAGAPDGVPQVVRALGPRATEEPDVAAPPRLDLASPPSDVLRAAIVDGTRRLLAHDPGVRLGADPEFVHQARVATRRLRSDLRTFGDLLDPDWADTLRSELAWLGEALGAVRDTEVLLDRIEGRFAELAPADVDDGKLLLDELAERRARAREHLLEVMRSERYLALLDALVGATRAPVYAAGVGAERVPDDVDDDPSDFVRRPWRKLRKAVDSLDPRPEDAALHRIRILAKRCRYAAEAVAPAVGREARRFARAMQEVQDVLGEHQDAVVAGEWLRQHATSPSAFVAGELAAMERAAARAARARWPGVWRRARRRRLRAWM